MSVTRDILALMERAPKEKHVQIRASDVEIKAWVDAAERTTPEGKRASLSRWIRETLNRAASGGDK